MKKMIIAVMVSVTLITGCSNMRNGNVGETPAQTAEETRIPQESPIVTVTPTADTHISVKQGTEEPNLILSTTPEKYSYEDMMSDIAALQQRYSNCNAIKLCETADGRDVCDIIIGDPRNNEQILIIGAMHAREYITTQVVMRQLVDCIKILSGQENGEYKEKSKKEILENVTVHFVPMSNPDGVSISQFGLEKIRDPAIKENVAQMGCTDYGQWKANAEGVDINRNFDAGWYEFLGNSTPSAERYKGTSPGSTEEAAALIKLTEDYRFKRTISYHTCGALIYWYYLQEGDVLEQSKKFAENVSVETGYALDSDYSAVDAAGYKDWAVYKMGIPSITIEVGNESDGEFINPVPISAFESIWERNKNVVYAAAYDL